MNIRSLKVKFILPMIIISLLFGLLLAIYAPYQSQKMGADILKKDAEFITGLLVDNLALSLQTIMLDDGIALEQSLNLVKNDDAYSTISDVLVFDENRKFLNGLSPDGKLPEDVSIDEVKFHDTDDILRVLAPVRDSGQNLLGFVEIDFSKKYLNETASGQTTLSLTIALIAVIAFLVPAVLTIRRATGSIDTLVDAARQVAEGSVDVDIDIKSSDEVEQLAGSFNDVVRSLREKSETAHAIARGNLGTDIQVLSDKDELGKAMLDMKASLQILLSELERMVEKQKSGTIDERCRTDQVKGAYRDVLENLNEAFDVFANPVLEAIEILKNYAKGNLDQRMRDLPGQQIVLTETINTINDNLNALIEEGIAISEQAKAGNLQFRGKAENFEGGYHAILSGFNGTLDALTGPLNVAADIIEKISLGQIPEKIGEDYEGDFNKIKENLNTCIESFQALVTDANQLIEGALAGKLDTRVDTERHHGDFRKIVDGINKTLNAVTAPINEMLQALEKLSEGDLTANITSEFQGDYAHMREALNSSVKALNNILTQVALSVTQISSSAEQVADSSQSVSEGATQQASSLEETSASMVEIASQSRQNADHAERANQLTTTASNAADKGDEHMAQMLDAMSEINDSSNQISKIIKVIDEIAFQTNLLALNAAVEAARAGVHGKGFAVVAEEVRNLAQRSARAAKETEQLIEGSVSRVDNGTKIARATAEALKAINENVSRASDLVDEISSASGEQVQGIDQVNQALQQIDDITQASTASAEQSASAAAELSGHAERLKKMLYQFKLAAESEQAEADAESYIHAEPVGADQWSGNGNGRNGNGSYGKPKTNPEDDDFGDF